MQSLQVRLRTGGTGGQEGIWVEVHLNPGPFNPRLFNHEHFNPGLFNHEFLNHGDEKFMVENSGVEMSSL